MHKLLSKIFGYFVKRRNRRFDNGKIKVVKCRVPVISVGNLSAGGTGKTPFVELIARHLIESGRKPAIVGRGYKRKSRGMLVVSDGNKLQADASSAGDEMFLLAGKFNVPIVVNKKKYLAAKFAEENFNIDSIIVDDGFQHRFLHRDLDIVLVDRDTLENPQHLPKGRLREPLENLSRADVIVLVGEITHNEHFGLIFDLNKLILKAGIYQGKIYNLFNKFGSDTDVRLEKNESAVAVCGIAKPKRFFDMLKQSGINIAAKLAFPDHNNYGKGSNEKIREKCKKHSVDIIITTEKDAVKLGRYSDFFQKHRINCLVQPIEMRIEEGEEEFIKLISQLFITHG